MKYTEYTVGDFLHFHGHFDVFCSESGSPFESTVAVVKDVTASRLQAAGFQWMSPLKDKALLCRYMVLQKPSHSGRADRGTETESLSAPVSDRNDLRTGSNNRSRS